MFFSDYKFVKRNPNDVSKCCYGIHIEIKEFRMIPVMMYPFFSVCGNVSFRLM